MQDLDKEEYMRQQKLRSMIDPNYELPQTEYEKAVQDLNVAIDGLKQALQESYDEILLMLSKVLGPVINKINEIANNDFFSTTISNVKLPEYDRKGKNYKSWNKDSFYKK